MVPVDLIFFDREAIGLIGETGEYAASLFRFLGKRPGRVNADDFNLPGLGKAVQQDEQGLHNDRSRRCTGPRNGGNSIAHLALARTMR